MDKPDLDRTTLLKQNVTKLKQWYSVQPALSGIDWIGLFNLIQDVEAISRIVPSEAPAVLNPHVQTFDTPQPQTVVTASEAPAEAFTANVTEKQLQVLGLWAAEYEQLSDPAKAPNLSAESRYFKLQFSIALKALLTDYARLVRERHTAK